MLKYRPDIDGLRALAVSAVVAFHVGLPGFGGGFAGVDVFFVISGFLITGILLEEHVATGRIDLPAFWRRRARRLAPAFLVVVVLVLAAAPFTLQRISGETGALAKAAIASILLNANHFFLSSAGEYFGAAAETNPLLHIWSLSVEEQFYLAWPLVLTLLWRPRSKMRRTTGMLMAVVVVSSFLGACWLTMADSKQAFYLMPTRAWELVALVGSWHCCCVTVAFTRWMGAVRVWALRECCCSSGRSCALMERPGSLGRWHCSR